MAFIPDNQLPTIGPPFARVRSMGKYDWSEGPPSSSDREGWADDRTNSNFNHGANHNRGYSSGGYNSKSSNKKRNKGRRDRRNERCGHLADDVTMASASTPRDDSSRAGSAPSFYPPDIPRSPLGVTAMPPSAPSSAHSGHFSDHERRPPSSHSSHSGLLCSTHDPGGRLYDYPPEAHSQSGSEAEYEGEPSLDAHERLYGLTPPHGWDSYDSQGESGDDHHEYSGRAQERLERHGDHEETRNKTAAHPSQHDSNSTAKDKRRGTRAPSPTPSPVEMTFSDLTQAGGRGSLVFRVHTPTSVSPLIWTGDVRTSGFASANWHLGLLTPYAYAAALEDAEDQESVRSPSLSRAPHSAKSRHLPEPWSDWTSSPTLRQSLIDHLTRKPWLRAHDPGDGQVIPADALSPFISTSADFVWVIWEVARRLAMEEVVEVAVIALQPSDTTNGRQPHPKRYPLPACPPGPGATGEVTLDPIPPLTDHRRHGRGSGEHGRMTHTEKDATDLALVGARTSREVLFYGRVFAQSVVANLAFTRETLPLTLPRHFFRFPPGEAWLDALVWAPQDDYKTTVRKMFIERV